MRHLQLFENYNPNKLKYPVTATVIVSSVEPDRNWDDPGNWLVYTHAVRFSFMGTIFDNRSKEPIEQIENGRFTLLGSSSNYNLSWCPELDAVFSKENMRKIAIGCNDIKEFKEELQEQVYRATLDYYFDLVNEESEDEDQDAEDDEDDEEEERIMNEDALLEITQNSGSSYDYTSPKIPISDECKSMVWDYTDLEDLDLEEAIETVLEETESDEEKALIVIHLDNSRMDDYFSKNPLKMYVLDNFPEMKQRVLQRTGLKDLSKVGRMFNKGLI